MTAEERKAWEELMGWLHSSGDYNTLNDDEVQTVFSAETVIRRAWDVEGMQTPLRMVLGRGLFEHDTYLLNIARAISAWLNDYLPSPPEDDERRRG